MMDSAVFYRQVGQKIRVTRECKGLRQRALAMHASLTRTSITNIEAGRQKFLLHTLFDIAKALETEPLALIADISPGNTTRLEAQLANIEPVAQEWIRRTLAPTPEEGPG